MCAIILAEFFPLSHGCTAVLGNLLSKWCGSQCFFIDSRAYRINSKVLCVYIYFYIRVKVLVKYIFKNARFILTVKKSCKPREVRAWNIKELYM